MRSSENKLAGFSLMEMLISIVIGMIIVAAASTMLVNILKAQKDITSSARLNQELGAVMTVMTNEIRRAGYTQCVDNPTIPDNECCEDPNKLICPSEEQKNLEYKLDATNAYSEDLYVDDTDKCVLYSYNRNGDDKKNFDERNGFKFENGNASYREKCGVDTDYNAVFDNCAKDCSIGTWVTLSSSNVFTILDSGSYFSTDGSKCADLLSGDYWIILEDSDSTKFPCLEEDGNVRLCSDGNSDGKIDYPSECIDTGSVPALATEAKMFEARQLTINVESELMKDNSVKKSLSTSVKIQNPMIVIKP